MYDRLTTNFSLPFRGLLLETNRECRYCLFGSTEDGDEQKSFTNYHSAVGNGEALV